nr:uncharacterized protein LOC112770180 [Arachis hypogaea]
MDDTLRIILQEQREFLKRQEATMASFAESISQLAPPPNNSQLTFQPSSSSAVLSQPLPNSKDSLNSIYLRSDTTLEERSPNEFKAKETTLDEDVVEVEDLEDKEEIQEVIEEEVAQARESGSKEEDVMKEAIPIPFSSLSKRTKKQMELDPKMVDNFKKVEVIIFLFDAIRQVPKYVKFLKDLCMNKERINKLEIILLGSSISALMGPIPENCGDHGPCLVSCTINGVQFVDSDKSIISVADIAEDVLVSIKGFIFPIDFYILEMPPNDSGKPSSILLGWPFLKTSRFKLDAFSDTYSFEIDGRAVSFKLDEVMKHPLEDHSIFRCDMIDEVVAKIHHETLHEINMSKGLSVEKDSDYNVDLSPLPLLQKEKLPCQDSNEELQPLSL